MGTRMWRAPVFGLVMFGMVTLGGYLPAASSEQPAQRGLGLIKHVVIVMQENRSFDEYFGTFPGVEGFDPASCNMDPARGRCVHPFHDPNDSNVGGPHGNKAHEMVLNGGAMDGFISAVETLPYCDDPDNDPVCGGGPPEYDVDAMGWHDAREIPNYWAYAENYVLQDHMFEPVHDYSAPAHQWLVSGWSADCARVHDPMSCSTPYSAPAVVDDDDDAPTGGAEAFPWTDITWLLYHHGISWRYYVEGDGTLPDCNREDNQCPATPQSPNVPSTWNPLPKFDSVRQDKQLRNVQDASNFFTAAADGHLPAVSWVIPNGADSEHPQAPVSSGQAWVTSLVNAAMQGPDWDSTAIFVSWDDWGGFYDHVVPPVVDGAGYGLRVPGLVISPYAKHGYVDSQVLSFDAYLKFIEDVFLGGARIDPATDGRPDSRPSVRENEPILGDLVNDFDFTQAPQPPLLLPEYPAPGPPSR